MIDRDRLARAIASYLCRNGYIDINGDKGCDFLDGTGDDRIPFLAQGIALEYENNEPKKHPHGAGWEEEPA